MRNKIDEEFLKITEDLLGIELTRDILFKAIFVLSFQIEEMLNPTKEGKKLNLFSDEESPSFQTFAVGKLSLYAIIASVQSEEKKKELFEKFFPNLSHTETVLWSRFVGNA